MLHFDSDYMEGCCSEILAKLLEINSEQNTGYGTDKYSQSAKEKILKACGLDNGEVYFLSGGTQTNCTVINAVLRNYEGVIAVDTGHISVHEAGAIEHSGHKVLTIPHKEGKLDYEDLKRYLEVFHSDGNRDHMVQPAMVYISLPTEYGTIYSKEELGNIYKVCKEYNIPLFVDGARLGYGLMAKENDISLEFLAENCDIFYIGGTKVGAMLGEAVVITKKGSIPHFFTTIKQQGALLAKGWIVGVQFDVLFTDNLYFKIAEHAISMADRLKAVLKKKGYKFYINSPTNQIFVIVDNEKMEKLKKYVTFGFWERYSEKETVIRFATSWATKAESIDELESIL